MSLVITEVTVTSVRDLSPSFRRVELSAPALAEFGVDGPVYDQRFKIVVPDEEGRLASCEGWDENWWDAWCALPEQERGYMRTYSVRDVVGEGDDVRLVVDFVLHLEPGGSGPAANWAADAAVGDRILVIGPRRGVTWGGIVFDPTGSTDLLLAGDETAVPAVSRILGDLEPERTGTAFLEVPHAEDALEVEAPAGFAVHWLPRDGRPYGERLLQAVIAHLGGPAPAEDESREPVDPDIWETPEDFAAETAAPAGIPGLYAWIAGESGVVTAMRRHLVKDLGVDRRQVAFMGYWRLGSSMG